MATAAAAAASSSIISAIDKEAQIYENYQIGEKGHVEHTWSPSCNYEETLCQLYFQIIRLDMTSKNATKSSRLTFTDIFTGIHKTIINKFDRILESLFTDYKNSSLTEKNRQYIASMIMILYRMTANIRDIIAGKGERSWGYILIIYWYKYSPLLAMELAARFWSERAERVHPFGSWRDAKYLSEFVYKTQPKLEDNPVIQHPLIQFAITEMIGQLKEDEKVFESISSGEASALASVSASETAESNRSTVSLVARWIPREKSKFGWMYEHIARKMYPELFKFAGLVNSESYKKATNLANMRLRKLLSKLNRHLDTTQIKMCGRTWREIEFNRVSSLTLSKFKKAFMNVSSRKSRATKWDERSYPHDDADRMICAENYKAHLAAASAGDTTAKVHGKRVAIYQLVIDAINLMSSYSAGVKDDSFEMEKARINLQWADNSKMNGALGNIIPMVDTSGSMNADNALYSAIALGIRTSECVHPAFRNRIMTFTSVPTWVNLDDCETFVDKVEKVRKAPWGQSTNFYAAAKLILDSLIENKVDPDDVSGLTLAIFSDMQMDIADKSLESKNLYGLEIYSNPDFDENNLGISRQTLVKKIKTLFAEAGIRAIGKPYEPPHILFWNLRSTTGFPSTSNEPNITMLSGFSPVLLNLFCNKGMDELHNLTPFMALKDILSHPRYESLDEIVERELAMMSVFEPDK